MRPSSCGPKRACPVLSCRPIAASRTRTARGEMSGRVAQRDISGWEYAPQETPGPNEMPGAVRALTAPTPSLRGTSQ